MNPRCQSHLSPAASTVLAAAFRRANSVNIGGEHLFLSVLEVDPGLIAKFKIDGFRPAALIGQMRSAAKTLEPRDPAMVFEILHLASRIALNIPVNNQHVLLASILEPASLVSTYIAQSGIDVTDLLQRKFYFMPRALELWSDPASVSDQAKCSYLRS